MKLVKYIWILFISLFLTWGCKTDNKIEQEKSIESTDTKDNQISVTEEQFAYANMVLGNMSKQSFPQSVKTSGTIGIPPKSKEIITSFYGGVITNFSLLTGNVIQKNQVVAVIENPVFVNMQQDYLEIKEKLKYLQSEYQRQKTLFDENISSQKKYLKAESDYKSQKAKLYGLKKKLKMLNININSVKQGNIVSKIRLYSPINGVISKVNVNNGMYINSQSPIIEIINTANNHIELSVFEKDLMKVKKKQNIRFRLPEASDVYYDAKVKLIEKTIDTENRTFKVIGELDKSIRNDFNIGMFVEAEIIINQQEAFALPKTAIVNSDESKLILKLVKTTEKEYIFKPVVVETGLSNQDNIEIISDKLKETDKFLTKGAYSLISEN